MSTGWPTPPTGGGFDTHLDEALSGYLDGELDEAAYHYAYQHLSTCAECRSRLDALSQVRTIVRSAPPVDPPFGFIERLVKERRRRPFTPVIATVVGLAAVSLLVLGLVASGSLRVEPPVNDIAVAQAGFDGGQASERGDFVAKEIEFAAADDDEIPTDFRPPDEVGGADFDAGFQATNRDGWLAMFDDDGDAIAVYQQMGEFQLSSLPGGGERFEIDGSRAWRSTGVDGRNAVVVQQGGMAYTVVGEVDVEDLVEVAEDLPERASSDTSWGDRLQDSVDRFLEGFSLGL